METLLQRWKTTATALAALAGMVWYGVTFADEVIRNAKTVPELQQITAENAEQIRRLVERSEHREAAQVEQGRRILEMLEAMQPPTAD